MDWHLLERCSCWRGLGISPTLPCHFTFPKLVISRDKTKGGTTVRMQNSHQVFSDRSPEVPEKSVVVKLSAVRLDQPSASSLLDTGSDISLALEWPLIPSFLCLSSPSRLSDCSPVDEESS